MMGIGFGEIVIIAGVALIVLGPEKFPDFAKIVLRTVRDLRGYMDDVKSEISKEIRPIQNEIKSLSRYDPETYLDAVSSSSSTTKGYTPSETSGDASPAVDSPAPTTTEGVGADPEALNLQAEGAIPDQENTEPAPAAESSSDVDESLSGEAPGRLDG